VQNQNPCSGAEQGIVRGLVRIMSAGRNLKWGAKAGRYRLDSQNTAESPPNIKCPGTSRACFRSTWDWQSRRFNTN